VPAQPGGRARHRPSRAFGPGSCRQALQPRTRRSPGTRAAQVLRGLRALGRRRQVLGARQPAGRRVLRGGQLQPGLPPGVGLVGHAVQPAVCLHVPRGLAGRLQLHQQDGHRLRAQHAAGRAAGSRGHLRAAGRPPGGVQVGAAAAAAPDARLGTLPWLPLKEPPPPQGAAAAAGSFEAPAAQPLGGLGLHAGQGAKVVPRPLRLPQVAGRAAGGGGVLQGVWRPHPQLPRRLLERPQHQHQRLAQVQLAGRHHASAWRRQLHALGQGPAGQRGGARDVRHLQRHSCVWRRLGMDGQQLLQVRAARRAGRRRPRGATRRRQRSLPPPSTAPRSQLLAVHLQDQQAGRVQLHGQGHQDHLLTQHHRRHPHRGAEGARSRRSRLALWCTTGWRQQARAPARHASTLPPAHPSSAPNPTPCRRSALPPAATW
jgi:hypothetical protein